MSIGITADGKENQTCVNGEEDDMGDEGTGSSSTAYRIPATKSLSEIIQNDQDDQSLTKYKQTLLGCSADQKVEVEPENINNVIVKRLYMMVPNRDDLVMQLDEVNKLKNKTFVVKEGVKFRIKIEFIVQRDIVTGLKYVQKSSRLGVNVDKMKHMVGSFAPKYETHCFITPEEEVPSGLTGRGLYSITSVFKDDDGHEHLRYEWSIEVKKDWDD